MSSSIFKECQLDKLTWIIVKQSFQCYIKIIGAHLKNMFEVNIVLSFLDLTLQNNFLKDNSESNGKVTES